MKLDICHITTYSYVGEAMDSINEIRLSPRTNYRQACYHHQITVEPSASLLSYEDFFGNRIHAFTVNEPHTELKVTVRSTVVTHDNDAQRRKILPPVEDWQFIGEESTKNRFAEFLLPTRYVLFSEEVLAYAQEVGALVEAAHADTSGGEIGVYDWVMAAANLIYEQFQYQPNTTMVNTTVTEFLRMKRGVCQDFAHLLIAICRLKGIPARYVSGYHFVGDLQARTAHFEQASHAWVEVYVPGTGWIGIDPTNNNQVGWRYVKLGHGRDYVDIVPIKGVYRGTPQQTMNVSVDVRKITK